jgi:signal transduction histidine kinase
MLDRVSAWSLRRRLALIASFALVSSIAFGGVAMYWAAGIEDDQMLDARLEQLGATVLSFVENELSSTAFVDPDKLPHLKTRPSAALLYRYQVWSRQGSLLLRSHETTADAPLMPLSSLGFATRSIQGEEYRVFALPSKNRELIVQVAENIAERSSQVGLSTAYYAGFLLIPFAVVSGASWLMLRRSLRAVETMADQLHHRNPLDLTPLRVDDPPLELLPILKSIDTLFDRVGDALSTERRFTSVAAHEMRTPLAGLRAQSQLASSARNDAERQDALDSLRTGVDRTSRLLDQLLDLARVEALPADGNRGIEGVDITSVYQDVMVELGPAAATKQISVGALFESGTLQGHRFGLSVLLRNLLANAIAYSPAGGRVEVHCAPQGGLIALTVDDSGPGIRAADRERAFERFTRLGQTRTQGVGLGLSIVLSAVQLHHARIELLDSPLGGLRVQVLFAPIAGAAQPPHDGQRTPA